jgi:hypothetical protein
MGNYMLAGIKGGGTEKTVPPSLHLKILEVK